MECYSAIKKEFLPFVTCLIHTRVQAFRIKPTLTNLTLLLYTVDSLTAPTETVSRNLVLSGSILQIRLVRHCLDIRLLS